MPAPTIAALSPTGGPVSGGQQVVITGTGLTGATAVTFGGTDALSFVVDSDTRITATCPAKPAGTYQVQVAGPGGASVDVPADDFTYYEDLTEVGNAVVASPTSTSIAITPGIAVHSGDVVVAMINVNVVNSGSHRRQRQLPLPSRLDSAEPRWRQLLRAAPRGRPQRARHLPLEPGGRRADQRDHDQGLPRRRHQRRLRRLAGRRDGGLLTRTTPPSRPTPSPRPPTTASPWRCSSRTAARGRRYSAPTGGFTRTLQAAPNNYRVGASYTKRITTAGAVGPVSATLSGPNDGMGLLFAIKQAGPTPPPGEPYAWGVASVGDYTYLADGAAGLKIYDVSDPDAPALVGSYDTPGEARDVAIAGDYAYVADGSAGVQVIDVVDPAMPRLVGSCPTAEPALHITLSRGTLYDDFESASGWTAIRWDGRARHQQREARQRLPEADRSRGRHRARPASPSPGTSRRPTAACSSGCARTRPRTAPTGSFTGRIRVRLYTASGTSRYFETIEGDLTGTATPPSTRAGTCCAWCQTTGTPWAAPPGRRPSSAWSSRHGSERQLARASRSTSSAAA